MPILIGPEMLQMYIVELDQCVLLKNIFYYTNDASRI